MRLCVAVSVLVTSCVRRSQEFVSYKRNEGRTDSMELYAQVILRVAFLVASRSVRPHEGRASSRSADCQENIVTAGDHTHDNLPLLTNCELLC
jgi:hypothetical protein